MLSFATAQTAIDQGVSLGADFVELFVEKNMTNGVNLLNEAVDSVRSGVDFGIGIRLIFGDKVLYTYTNSLESHKLCQLIQQLASGDQRAQRVETQPMRQEVTTSDRHSARLELATDTYLQAKVDLLRQADKTARGVSAKIIKSKSFVLQRQQEVQIFNSEGLAIEDNRHYSRCGLTAIAADGRQATGSWNDGGMLGWELAERIDPQIMGEEASRQALVNLTAKPCPSGHMPVVMGPGFGGVIFHEACGHLLETTSVAQKASVFHDKMGEMIASPVVNAVDEGRSANNWGSINIDDEGLETQRTQLITNGKLTSFLVDKIGAEQTGYARTGSGRRESYRYAPASRMRNTFIEAGSDRLEDMIASIDYGLYASHLGGGSVSPGTGEFNFAVVEAYMIEKGKITYPVKAATLISTGPEVLKKISMVGDDFKLACGMCGSVSGSIPTSVGQPSLKVDDILVGGNA